MKRSEQKQFVKDLAKTAKDVAKKIIENIDNGKIPADWDGHELRQLLADNFTSMVLAIKMDRKQRREYNNIVAVNNL
jgi:hypothetical protein